jgi:acetylornithine deacetylase
LNLAAIDGGLAFNIIPTQAKLVFSIRPPPGANIKALLEEAERALRNATRPDDVTWDVVIANPPFQTANLAALAPLFGAAPPDAIDLGFWTEAALLAEAGIDSVVFGPGSIEQAHGADEYVELAELERASLYFQRILSGGH